MESQQTQEGQEYIISKEVKDKLKYENLKMSDEIVIEMMIDSYTKIDLSILYYLTLQELNRLKKRF